MGSFSIWHLVILGVVVLVLFGGKGKISDLMGDFGKGVNSFKKGLNDDAAPGSPAAPPPQVTQNPQATAKTPVEDAHG